jgi:hypothetical protein
MVFMKKFCVYFCDFSRSRYEPHYKKIERQRNMNHKESENNTELNQSHLLKEPQRIELSKYQILKALIPVIILGIVVLVAVLQNDGLLNWI